MTRPTSVETYRKILDENLLPKRRLAMYKALYRLRQGTASEIAREAGKEAGKCPWKRIGELVQQGVAVELPERTCAETGQLAIVYALTDNLPKRADAPEVVAPKPAPNEMRRAIQELRKHLRFAQKNGRQVGPELAKLGKWLSHRYEDAS